ncbi:hypothetical protein EXIGLDRAFT_301515 [Exidia glandulosa HHB12029]|uniref:Uncharacterized protein n=1 Tax=Exidia glandulosa HHB12029 TaxID=1314781 RepID=A0A165D7U2_EXIGL|nr:hypothetical protein EXIGLDRAFT_301515 [Exidia glandulosa HHB12029]
MQIHHQRCKRLWHFPHVDPKHTRLPQNQLIGTARLALSIEKARGPCEEATVSQGDCSVRARSAGTEESERRSPSTLRYRGQLATDVRVVVECTTSSRKPLWDMKKPLAMKSI